MSDEIIVNKYIGNKFLGKLNFRNYDKALDYAKKASYLGYKSIILCLQNKKVWRKIIIYPPENI